MVKDNTKAEFLDVIKSKYAEPNSYHISLDKLLGLIKNKKIPKSEYTLEEIAYLCGISRERVRQIEFKAMQKIKNSMIKPTYRDIRNVLMEYLEEGTSDMMQENSVNEMMANINTHFRKSDFNN